MFRPVIRPLDLRRDVPAVFAAYADPLEQALFANRAPASCLEEFERWLAAQLRGPYADFAVAEDPATGRVAGFAFAYDLRPFDGHCKVCVYVFPAYRLGTTSGILAAAFLDGLFARYPLSKVYALVYGYNAPSLASSLHAGFVEEGCLRGYRFFDGEAHDCHVLALTRAAFRDRLARLSPLRRKEARHDDTRA